MGKISRKKLLTTKRLISINTDNSRFKVNWERKSQKFCLIGESDIEGFEKINWKWKQRELESKLVLMEEGDKERVIAEFKTSNWKLREIGKLVIFEDLPDGINLFITCSGAYYISRLTEEEITKSIAS